jgi:WD40 repeat protein
MRPTLFRIYWYVFVITIPILATHETSQDSRDYVWITNDSQVCFVPRTAIEQESFLYEQLCANPVINIACDEATFTAITGWLNKTDLKVCIFFKQYTVEQLCAVANAAYRYRMPDLLQESLAALAVKICSPQEMNLYQPNLNEYIQKLHLEKPIEQTLAQMLLKLNDAFISMLQTQYTKQQRKYDAITPEGTVEGSSWYSMNNDHTILGHIHGNKIRLYGTSSGTHTWSCIGELPSYYNSISSVHFHSDKPVVITAAGDTIRLWNAQDQTCITTIVYHNTLIHKVAFNPNGTLFASRTSTQIALWDYPITSCAPMHTLTFEAVYAFNWSPNGAFFAVIHKKDDGTVVSIWDTRTWYCIHTLPMNHEHKSDYYLITWSPESNLLLCLEKESTALKIWDTTYWKGIPTLPSLKEVLPAQAFRPIHKITSCLFDSETTCVITAYHTDANDMKVVETVSRIDLIAGKLLTHYTSNAKNIACTSKACIYYSEKKGKIVCIEHDSNVLNQLLSEATLAHTLLLIVIEKNGLRAVSENPQLHSTYTTYPAPLQGLLEELYAPKHSLTKLKKIISRLQKKIPNVSACAVGAAAAYYSTKLLSTQSPFTLFSPNA